MHRPTHPCWRVLRDQHAHTDDDVSAGRQSGDDHNDCYHACWSPAGSTCDDNNTDPDPDPDYGHFLGNIHCWRRRRRRRRQYHIRIDDCWAQSKHHRHCLYYYHSSSRWW